MDLEDIIQFETESTYCDFKATQYIQDSKDKVRDFLVDIMSFANADIDSDRFIVEGIKHKNDVERIFLGIDKENFKDPAIYQQIVHQNIEPDIDFDYILFEFNGKYYGVFKITNCNQQPYLMKKDYGDRLKRGDSYIRKGRHNTKMERRDFDRIYNKKSLQKSYIGDVEIKFSENQESTIQLSSLKEFVLPSRQAAEKIEGILEKRKKNPFIEKSLFLNPSSFFGSTPYESRSTEELERNLSIISQAYSDDDAYELYEHHSQKINFLVENKGQQYIEDATIEVTFPKMEGLLVVDKIYEKPIHNSNPLALPQLRSFDSMNYPSIKEQNDSIIILVHIGAIKHLIPVNTFDVPIRVIFSPLLSGEIIEVQCKIYAKNLTDPIIKNLKINIV